jgi:hypothetical protein
MHTRASTQTPQWHVCTHAPPLQYQLACISLGSALYTGRMMSSGTAGPRLFMRSYSVWHAVSISSWPGRRGVIWQQRTVQWHASLVPALGWNKQQHQAVCFCML